MKSNQKDLNQIALYLQGRLTKEETYEIQERIIQDPDFAKLVEEMRIIQDTTILSKKKSLLSTFKKWEEAQKENKDKNDE